MKDVARGKAAWPEGACEEGDSPTKHGGTGGSPRSK